MPERDQMQSVSSGAMARSGVELALLGERGERGERGEHPDAWLSEPRPEGVRQIEYELNNVLMVLLGNVELAEAGLPAAVASPTGGVAATGPLSEIRVAAERVLELSRLLARAAKTAHTEGARWPERARVHFLPE